MTNEAPRIKPDFILRHKCVPIYAVLGRGPQTYSKATAEANNTVERVRMLNVIIQTIKTMDCSLLLASKSTPSPKNKEL